MCDYRLRGTDCGIQAELRSGIVVGLYPMKRMNVPASLWSFDERSVSPTVADHISGLRCKARTVRWAELLKNRQARKYESGASD